MDWFWSWMAPAITCGALTLAVLALAAELRELPSKMDGLGILPDEDNTQ